MVGYNVFLKADQKRLWHSVEQASVPLTVELCHVKTCFNM